MPAVHKSALVAHPAEAMYNLVNNIESYPEFLPWCGHAQIVSRTQQEIWATVQIRKGRVHRAFTTRNRLTPGRQIQLRLVDGPFKRLEGAWQFKPLRDDACKVMLDLEFEFDNTMLRMVVGPVFEHIANTMVDAFCRRAAEVYKA